MASRRSRIVIKPNIKPAASKSAAAKPKVTGDSIKSPGVAAHNEVTPAAVPDGKQRHKSGNDCVPERKIDAVNSSLKRKTDTIDGQLADRTEKEDIRPPRIQSPLTAASVRKAGDGKKKEVTSSGEERKELEQAAVRSPDSASFEACTATPVSGKQDVSDSALVAQPGDLQNVGDGPAAEVAESGGEVTGEVVVVVEQGEKSGVNQEEETPQRKHRRRKDRKQLSGQVFLTDRSPDRQKMKMSDLLLWNPQNNFFPTKKKKKSVSLKEESRSSSPSVSVSVEDEDSQQSTSLPAPQIMVGADGNIIVNSESLLIPNTRSDDKPKTVIEEDDDDRYLNTNSYRKYEKAKIWSEAETEKFFLGLSMCGTDFSLLEKLFITRSRRELKNKFRREERLSRPLIDKALSRRCNYDPTPFEKFRARVEAEEEAKLKIKLERKRVKAEPAEKTPTLAKKLRIKKRKANSEDEEDDWGSDCDDEENAENVVDDGADANVDPNETSAHLPVMRRKKKEIVRGKKVIDYPNKPRPLHSPCFSQGDTTTPFVPFPHGRHTNTSSVAAVAQEEQETSGEVVSRFPAFAAKSSENLVSPSPSTQSQCVASSSQASGPSNAVSNALQGIPGSSQIRIEMEGVQKPVQGILIPSHLVPQIAPQLGIENASPRMQVLLVQEESSQGSVVHVYVVPEGNPSSLAQQPPSTALPQPQTAPPAQLHDSRPAESSLMTSALPEPSTSHAKPRVTQETSLSTVGSLYGSAMNAVCEQPGSEFVQSLPSSHSQEQMLECGPGDQRTVSRTEPALEMSVKALLPGGHSGSSARSLSACDIDPSQCKDAMPAVDTSCSGQAFIPADRLVQQIKAQRQSLAPCLEAQQEKVPEQLEEEDDCILVDSRQIGPF